MKKEIVQPTTKKQLFKNEGQKRQRTEALKEMEGRLKQLFTDTVQHDNSMVLKVDAPIHGTNPGRYALFNDIVFDVYPAEVTYSKLESSTLAETNPWLATNQVPEQVEFKFNGDLELGAKEYVREIAFSLKADSMMLPGTQQLIEIEVRNQLMKDMSSSIFAGDGDLMPTGIRTALQGTNQVIDGQVTTANVQALINRIKKDERNGARFYCSSDTVLMLHGLILDGVPIFDGVNLLGYEVRIDDMVNGLLFGNVRNYKANMVTPLELAEEITLLKGEGRKKHIYALMLVDGNVIDINGFALLTE